MEKRKKVGDVAHPVQRMLALGSVIRSSDGGLSSLVILTKGLEVSPRTLCTLGKHFLGYCFKWE